jgi:thiol-disulfide isomerase/thioredoxin
MNRYIIGLGLALTGCSRETTSPADNSPDARGVSLQVACGDELTALVRRERGNVVLVDFWATWCDPCVRLFPHSVALQSRLGDRGLQVISVSLNEPEEQAAVLAFLRRMHAALPNLISRYGASTQSMETFQIDAAIPCLKLYDREGRLRKTFGADDPPTPAKIDRAVEELLAPPATPRRPQQTLQPHGADDGQRRQKGPDMEIEAKPPHGQ